VLVACRSWLLSDYGCTVKVYDTLPSRDLYCVHSVYIFGRLPLTVLQKWGTWENVLSVVPACVVPVHGSVPAVVGGLQACLLSVMVFAHQSFGRL